MKKVHLKLTDERMKELLRMKEVVFLQHDAVTVALTLENYDDVCRNLGDKAQTITWEVW